MGVVGLWLAPASRHVAPPVLLFCIVESGGGGARVLICLRVLFDVGRDGQWWSVNP